MSEQHAQQEADAVAPKQPGMASLFPEMPALKDIFVGDFAEVGDWVVANVETTMFWPVSQQKVSYRGETIWIVPITETSYPAVAMKARGDFPRAVCQKIMMRFLSALAWVEGNGMSVTAFTGGGRPLPLGRSKRIGVGVTASFDFNYLPEPDDDKALLALALMRESRSLNHPGYAFLAAYRVLEVAFGKGRAAAVSWMAANIGAVDHYRARDVVADLTGKGVADIPAHLYESGRCAMAHAAEEPIVDPDAPEDTRRLANELPLMVGLAVRVIETAFGVETPLTRYRKHLYELDGFKGIFGEVFVRRMVEGEPMGADEQLIIPPISFRIYGQPPFPGLEGLVPVHAGRNEATVILGFQSANGLLDVQIGLNFGTERLEFEMFRDIGFADTGTAESAQMELDLTIFTEALFLNGQLELFNTDTGERLSHKDAYLPVNMMFNNEASKARRAQLQRTVDERKASEAL